MSCMVLGSLHDRVIVDTFREVLVENLPTDCVVLSRVLDEHTVLHEWLLVVHSLELHVCCCG